MAIGSGRISPGNINNGSGGGGGNSTDSIIVTGINLIAGNTDVAHGLGKEPQTSTFFDSLGRTQVLQWEPKTGSLTTEIVVSAFAPMNGVTAMLSATGSSGGIKSNILTGKTINAGTTDIIHGLGEQPLVVMFYNANGQPQILQWQPKAGSEDTTITVTSFVNLTDITIQLSTNN